MQARVVPLPRLRPGVSETFSYPMRRLGGELPLAWFDVGEGPPVLLIHGLGGNVTHWEHVVPELARRHRVIGLDLPGCGDSAKPEIRYTIELCVEAALRVLDAAGVERADLIGHSLGGQVAAHAALHHPGRVRALGLIDAAGFVRYPPAARWLSRLLFRRELMTPVMTRWAIDLLHVTFYEKNEYVRRFIGQTEGREPHPTVDDFGRLLESIGQDLVQLHYLDRLEQFVLPTLVLWGDQDKLLPLAGPRRWVPKLPNGKLVVLRGCGHIPIIERPRQVSDELLRFLASVETPLAALA